MNRASASIRSIGAAATVSDGSWDRFVREHLSEEVPISYLVSRRDAFLRRGVSLPNFAIVNADRPFPEVYREVAEHLERLVGTRRRTEPSAAINERHT